MTTKTNKKKHPEKVFLRLTNDGDIDRSFSSIEAAILDYDLDEELYVYEYVGKGKVKSIFIMDKEKR